MVQVPVPAQAAPLQPEKTDPVAGAGVNVTVLPELNCEEQVLPQSMPAGELVTEPEPPPARATETVYCGVGGGPKVAVTDWFELNVTLHAPVPEQAPLQPVNTEPSVAGVAARLIGVPEL